MFECGLGCLKKGTQPPMVQGRFTNIISMIQWIRTSGLSIKHSICLNVDGSSSLDATFLLYYPCTRTSPRAGFPSRESL